VRPTSQPLLDAQRSAELWIRVAGAAPPGSTDGGMDFDFMADKKLTAGSLELLGYLGELSVAAREQFELRGAATVAELRFAVLERIAELVPKYRQPPVFPTVSRDLNLVVNEAVEWADVERSVREAGGPLVATIEFRQQYRDEQRLGAGKKSLLFTLVLRSGEGTLTNDQADQVRERVVSTCAQRHGAQLRA
jgi:phenylalanyl-tRNA synthetase beta chain